MKADSCSQVRWMSKEFMQCPSKAGLNNYQVEGRSNFFNNFYRTIIFETICMQCHDIMKIKPDM